MHEAGAVARHQYFRAGSNDGSRLVCAHGDGGRSVFDRESATESTALFGSRQVHQLEATNGLEQTERALADVQQPT